VRGNKNRAVKPCSVGTAPGKNPSLFRSPEIETEFLFFVSMAFSRSLSSRATLIARRYQPSFAYIFHDDDRKTHPSTEPQSTQKPGNFGQQRSFGTGFSNSSSGLCGVLFHDRRCSQLAFLPGTGVSFGRFMSTKVNDGAKEVELMTDVAEAFKDTAIEAVTSQVPAVNEVAVAAADCWLPVATLQYVIDAVHSFTGFNWWASIVVTTLLIRSATVPLLINQLKATTKMTVANEATLGGSQGADVKQGLVPAPAV
ncbi:hypothetical protein Godav_007303, partial [Gossypium davidsonii]|nr:hypothetical protein [Gossypium davidsonii]